MSIQAVAWALKTDLPSPTMKLVLIAVCNYADEEGTCWPSQARLARECCLSERSVRDTLAKLEAAGFIRREPRHDNAHRRMVDMIRVTPSHRKILPVEKPPENDAEATGSSRQKPPERRSGKPLIEPSKNHYAPASRTKASKKHNYTEQFEYFWEQVPKHDNPGSKADAFRSFESLDEEDRLRAIKGWWKYLEWLGRKRAVRPDYPIKQLVTFINQRLWETYLPPEADQVNAEEAA